MAGGILGIATSGLLAFQRSLETTSHNIANVNTEGYSRQRTELSTKPAIFEGSGYLGQGVKVSNITRSYDQFISSQLRTSSTASGEAEQFYRLSVQVDGLLADNSVGIAPAIKSFFNTVNEVADDPSSIPARQVMLSEADLLRQRFNTMSARFEELGSQVNTDIKVHLNEINALGTALADLNNRIAADVGRASGKQLPNDLLDERERLLTKLAELISVAVVPQENGMTSIFIGKGMPLVLDGVSSKLTTINDEYDPTFLRIGYESASGTTDISNQISGGKLAGSLRFRDEILDPAQQKLGQIAAGLAMEMNALQKSGFDLDGRQGEALFSFKGDEVPVTANLANTGNAVVTARFQDLNVTPDAAQHLDFSDFRLEFVGGSDYTLTRLRDNQVFSLTAVVSSIDPNVSNLTFAGFEISIDTSAGSAVAGDRFLTRPTYQAAKKIGVNIGDPRQIAAATNVEVDPVTGKPVFDSSGNAIIIKGPMPGDNRNALLMAQLESKMGLLGGKASFHNAYSQLVAGVGSLTRSGELSATAQKTLLTRAQEAKENLTGVNLDEEAANLVIFQQSYQAAAQVISTANSMFDTLIGALR
ncbi:MAG: flagellar hook-associated protein FlgK [Methylicorpusculum sp.]|uniref:flagellar hook-associated protein FlgK n=1 Tax=Methylicorpusculum sp. TaxID=2713644 RepID=UPI0027219386|nr:flagellar hook-associated protein FlgK [Methylicorpusculum sp.]MDO8940234.1 flagellar hook-associated protein FlgK [Methylicorpusculum sp.]MDP2201103.1 flagellar hook-associated protein FlgK [Methylicorpusculum sp.]